VISNIDIALAQPEKQSALANLMQLYSRSGNLTRAARSATLAVS